MAQCISRRHLLASGLASLCVGGTLRAAPPEPRFEFCAFVKFVQTLSHDELAQRIAEMGFAGIEATVRRRGQVLPERVEEDLPRLVEALDKQGLKIAVMATDVNAVDKTSEKVLRTAAKLGITRYRMANYRYAAKQPLQQQLVSFAAQLKDLVALNRELKIAGVYQNHAGASIVGAPVWDLQRLLAPYSPQEVGAALDIRHATVEGGLGWPLHFRLLQPHLGAVYVKDFVWEGRRPRNVPLGTGQVDPQFFTRLKECSYRGPVSLHVEYLGESGVEKNLAALKTDLGTLRKLLA